MIEGDLLLRLPTFFQKLKNRKARRIGFSAFSVVALTAGLSGCGSSGANNTIVIGGKNFTEQLIMSNVLQQLIHHDDPKLNIVMKDNLDTDIAWNAMKTKKVDLYVEYTGTGLVNILKDKTTTDPQTAYNEVKKQFQSKYHITWLKPIGFNNTYAMVMRQSEAKRLGITTDSQMAAQSGNFVLGSEQAFITRHDALPAMKKLYGTHFKSVKSMQIGLKYAALKDKKVDVIDGYSTDPQIPEFHLIVLKDDKHLFPPYYAVPIIQDSTLKAHPELKGILNKLAGTLTDSGMQHLNYLADVKHETPAQVATGFLKSKGLI